MSSEVRELDMQHATDAIRAEYEARKLHVKPSPGRAMYASRMQHYRELLLDTGRLPLEQRRILDVGCANGKWLDSCCANWGAQETLCVGTDLRAETLAEWRREHPDSKITLICIPAHQLDLPAEMFDVVHQSMMLSSIPHQGLRREVAAHMWHLLKPGGLLISYDFWTNPLNRATVGITHAELRRLFPQAQWAWSRTITLAPPLCRQVVRFSAAFALSLERLRVLNTHHLVALAKPARSA